MRNRRDLIVRLTVAVAVAAAIWPAHAIADGALLVKEAWSRPSPPRVATGAAYMRVENPGPDTIRIAALRSPVAERVEIHETRVDQGIARMRRVDDLTIPSGGAVELGPGGLHIMMMGLKTPLVADAMFSLILVLADGREVSVDVRVRARP